MRWPRARHPSVIAVTAVTGMMGMVVVVAAVTVGAPRLFWVHLIDNVASLLLHGGLGKMSYLAMSSLNVG